MRDQKYSLLAYIRGSGKRVTVKISKRNPQPPEGATSYYLRYMDNGKRRDVALGTDFHDALTEISAREFEDRTGQKLVRQAPQKPAQPEPEPEPEEPAKTPLAEKIEEWLRKFEQRHNHTYKSFRHIIYNFRDSCGRKFVEQITSEDLFKFAGRLDREDYAQQTISTYFGVVMIFLKYAGIRLGIPTKDRPDYDPRDVETYTTEQLDALFMAATTEESLIFKSFFYTGMRNQELAHLTCADIDFKHSIWSVRSKRELRWKAKSKAGARRIPVPPFHTKDVHDYMILSKRSGNDLVFPNSKGEVQHCYTDILQRLAKRAGVTGRVDTHKFRSTCATTWLRAGVDMEEVRKRLGHSDYKMIQRYVEAWKLESAETRTRTAEIFERWNTRREA